MVQIANGADLRNKNLVNFYLANNVTSNGLGAVARKLFYNDTDETLQWVKTDGSTSFKLTEHTLDQFGGSTGAAGLAQDKNLGAFTFNSSKAVNSFVSGDLVSKEYVDQYSTFGKAWKETLLSVGQLNDTQNAINPATVYYVSGNGVINSGVTITLTDGTTTENYAYGTEITNGTDAQRLSSFASSINGSSAVWGASYVSTMTEFNNAGETAPAQDGVLVIWRKDPTTAGAGSDRVYKSAGIGGGGLIVDYNGSINYEGSTGENIPTSDPAVTTFGFLRLEANLTTNETHMVRDEDKAYTYDAGGTQWVSSGGTARTAGEGLSDNGSDLDLNYSTLTNSIVSALDGADLVSIYDNDVTTQKKMTLANFLTDIAGSGLVYNSGNAALDVDTSEFSSLAAGNIATGDTIPIYDISGTSQLKTSVGDLATAMQSIGAIGTTKVFNQTTTVANNQTFNHGFNTRNVSVTLLKQSGSEYFYIVPDYTSIDANNTNVTFDTTPSGAGEYKVIITCVQGDIT